MEVAWCHPQGDTEAQRSHVQPDPDTFCCQGHAQQKKAFSNLKTFEENYEELQLSLNYLNIEQQFYFVGYYDAAGFCYHIPHETKFFSVDLS